MEPVMLGAERRLRVLAAEAVAGVERQEPETESYLREWWEHSAIILPGKFAPSVSMGGTKWWDSWPAKGSDGHAQQ